MRLIYFALILFFASCVTVQTLPDQEVVIRNKSRQEVKETISDNEIQFTDPFDESEMTTDAIMPAALRTIPGLHWELWAKDTLAANGAMFLSQNGDNNRESRFTLQTLIDLMQDSIAGGSAQSLTWTEGTMTIGISGGNSIVVTGFADSTITSDSLAAHLTRLIASENSISNIDDTLLVHRSELDALPISVSGAYDYITNTNQDIILGQVDLTTDVTGVLPQSSFDTTGLSGGGGGGADNLGNHNATQTITFDSFPGLLILDGSTFMHSYSGGKSGEFENLSIGWLAGDSMRASPSIEQRANTFIGRRAGVAVKSGVATEASSNTVVGYHAGASLTIASFNSIFGTASGENITTGSRNLLAGWHSGRLATGSNMVLLGPEAGENTTMEIVAIGQRAGRNTTTGTLNTFVGSAAGQSANGSNNTFVGHNSASQATSTGGNNSFLGARSGEFVTSAADNTLIGYNAGNDLTEGNNNVLIGSGSGQLLTTGDGNVTIGYMAGETITTQSNNILIGQEAGENGTPANTIAIGQRALRANSQSGCVAIGALSFELGTGIQNVGLGFRAGNGQTGESNTAIGHNALGNGAGAGAFNSAFGTEAGRSNTSGITNVFFGRYAGYNNTTGSHNTYIGTNAGETTLSGNYNIIIGRSTNPSTNTVSNELNIGNILFGQGVSNVRATGIASGEIGIGTDDPDSELHVVGTVTIDNILQLTPIASAPGSPSEGMVYANSTDNHLYFHNGTTWVQLDN